MATSAGKGNTETLRTAEVVHPFIAVTLKLYSPLLFKLTLLMTVFCAIELNPEGPDHWYKATDGDAPTFALSVMLAPEHTFVLVVLTVIEGKALNNNETVCVFAQSLPSFISTV